MGNNNKTKEKQNFSNMSSVNKTPKFNPYWIYGIVIISFLAIQWFTLGSGPVETNWNEVKSTMLANNDIKKIIIVNEKEAQIYLKESSYDKYAAKLNTGFTAPAKAGPHYYFEVGPPEAFANNLKEAQANVAEENKIGIEYKTVHNYMGEILSWVFAICCLYTALLVDIQKNE